jgi:hypothetical protein
MHFWLVAGVRGIHILDEEVAMLPRRRVDHGEEDEAGWLLFLFRTGTWVGFVRWTGLRLGFWWARLLGCCVW